MNRLLVILTICAAACTPTADVVSPVPTYMDGYDLRLSEVFRTSDRKWRWKWRLHEGGVENIRDDTLRDGRFSVLTHVTGTDPHGNAVSYICNAVVDHPVSTAVTFSSKVPSCVHEHGADVFAPLRVNSVEHRQSFAGKLKVDVEIILVPTSWLKFEPRVVGVARYEDLS